MQWQVVVELAGADGEVRRHEVYVGGNTAAVCSAETLGLRLAEAKQILAALQHHVVQAQAEEYCQARRRCPRCAAQTPLKDRRCRRLRSLFGVVEVHAPRFAPCPCSVSLRETLSPISEILPDRCTPYYERMLAKMGALLPYRRARTLLEELFPLGEPPMVETVRQRTLRVGARLERQAIVPRSRPPAAKANAITLSIDSGHVKSVRSYQVRSFEIFVAQASNDDGKPITFASVPAEACQQAPQLREVLHELGATPVTPVTILSDGAEGPRSLGEIASVGPTRHVLDWFHLSMRVQHVARAVKGWPETTARDRQERARLTDIVEEHIRWRLWHGQVARALDLIGDTLESLDALAGARSPAAPSARKVAGVLRGLETYVAGHAELIIDYAAARRCEEPISTATTESTVQWLLHRRMNASQQMRWSPRGAHLMLKVRTAVVNGAFDRDHAAAECRARRPLRRAA